MIETREAFSIVRARMARIDLSDDGCSHVVAGPAKDGHQFVMLVLGTAPKGVTITAWEVRQAMQWLMPRLEQFEASDARSGR